MSSLLEIGYCATFLRVPLIQMCLNSTRRSRGRRNYSALDVVHTESHMHLVTTV